MCNSWGYVRSDRGKCEAVVMCVRGGWASVQLAETVAAHPRAAEEVNAR